MPYGGGVWLCNYCTTSNGKCGNYHCCSCYQQLVFCYQCRAAGSAVICQSLVHCCVTSEHQTVKLPCTQTFLHQQISYFRPSKISYTRRLVTTFSLNKWLKDLSTVSNKHVPQNPRVFYNVPFNCNVDHYPHFFYPSQIKYWIKFFYEFTDNHVQVETTVPRECEEGRFHHIQPKVVLFSTNYWLESELLCLLYHTRGVKWYLILFKECALKLQRV